MDFSILIDGGREICGNLRLSPGAAEAFLSPMADHLHDHGVRSIAEIFDGDPPFTPRGSIVQAWSVAETLRAWLEIESVGRLGLS